MAIRDTYNTDRPLLAEKWAEVYQQMAVHTQDYSPELIFSQRRPIESNSPVAINYRLDNYRNVVKSAFDLAIEQYIEAAYNVDAVVSMGEQTAEYIEAVEMFDGYKQTTLKEWLFSFVGRYKQTDPNALVAVIPMHPTDELIPRYDADIPVMETAANMPPRPVYWLIPSRDITDITEKGIKFKAGAWVYDDKGNEQPYYFEMTGEQITLHYPVSASKGKYEYREQAWYAPEYGTYTAYVIGSKAIVFSDDNGDMHQYYTSDFHGAANIADKHVANSSDLDVIETRFTHPMLWMRKKECDAMGCMPNIKTGRHEVNGKVCKKCGGSGYVYDTSPMGAFLLDEEKDFAENGSPKLPAGFITPDTAILKHKAERVEYYYEWMLKELGLNVRQNMTNTSGESKRYDLMQKVTLISGIVIDLYSLYESILAATAHYLGDSEDVKVTLPKDLDVKNANDISEELTEAKRANLPYAVLTELTKKYMLSKFGNNEKNRIKIDYLAIKDKLFVYGIDDMQKAVAMLGRAITDRERLIHVMGWQVLGDVLKDDIEIDESTIDARFMERIDAMMPTTEEQVNTLI